MLLGFAKGKLTFSLDRLKAIASNAASGGKPQPQKPAGISAHWVMCFWKCFVIPIFYP
ncbi:MAG UNVERIFIED_CONTAM: hypothetical protein LVR29_08955 [Microcystis novacekii LVE1205-3]